MTGDDTPFDTPFDTPLTASLRRAVAAAPDDVPLRLHLARLLLDAGRGPEAVVEVAAALQRAPEDREARALMTEAVGGGPATRDAPEDQRRSPRPGPGPGPGPAGFDWARAESEVRDVSPPPPFVTGPEPTSPPAVPPADPPPHQRPRAPLAADGSGDAGDVPAWDVEPAGELRLADVGGMRAVKERLEAAFLAPLRNPELRRLFHKSLRGGLLLYGPPGCGKTFLARAVAGELGARFINVAINDVLDMWAGSSERNLNGIFTTARRHAPCVVFLDELDALGGKRSRIHHGPMRNTVNQLLTELDGVSSASDNEGVFVLAATNSPWDVDAALRRPGRLDRTLLVLPPDEEARETILRYHLRDRPVAGVDLGRLARRTDGFSGADLAHVCETAAEHALLDSVRDGRPRMIGMPDLLASAREVRPSTDAWFATARNVALFSNEGGTYDELLAYLKRRKLV
ncbi:ATP-binding protein [Streptomyces sp. 4N509B]|uniref:ATP-binding protein n=1 Tax=Streptomyces sp. 4N509B TaxID=3457413 RepID=UPI003FD11AF1